LSVSSGYIAPVAFVLMCTAFRTLCLACSAQHPLRAKPRGCPASTPCVPRNQHFTVKISGICSRKRSVCSSMTSPTQVALGSLIWGNQVFAATFRSCSIIPCECFLLAVLSFYDAVHASAPTATGETDACSPDLTPRISLQLVYSNELLR
jgi:hypothetical protein